MWEIIDSCFLFGDVGKINVFKKNTQEYEFIRLSFKYLDQGETI